MNAEEMKNKLDAYLDDQLDAAERAAFEESLESHPEIRSEIEMQRNVDASLKRLYPVPSTSSLVEKLPASSLNGQSTDNLPFDQKSDKVKPSASRQWLALAALIAICGLAGWRFMAFSESNVQADFTTMAGTYKTEVARGFEPLWVCETDEEFANTFKDRFGQPLLLNELPPDVRAVGLSYAAIISGETTYLLATVDGDEVIVFIDAATHGTKNLPADSGLRVFTRQIGSLMLHEVSRLDQAYLLDAFFIPSD